MSKVFERVWRITIIPKKDFSGFKAGEAIVISDSRNIDWDTGKDVYKRMPGTPLHCKFNVESAMKEPQSGTLTIYNLNKSTIDLLSFDGGRVVIEAGYKQSWGKIWDGKIFHISEYREGVVDRVLNIVMLRGSVVSADTFIIGSLSGKRKVNNKLEWMTTQMRLENAFSEPLKEEGNETVRRSVYFGEGSKYLRDELSLRGRKLVVNNDGKLTDTNIAQDVPKGMALEVSPETGLIGIPEQVDRGVSFSCLLDHRLKYDPPNYVRVKLKNTETRAMQVQYGGTPPFMSKDGEYLVILVNHIGDTRGNDWKSSVQTIVDASMIVENAPSDGARTANGRYS